MKHKRKRKHGHVKKAKAEINSGLPPRDLNSNVTGCGSKPVEPPQNTTVPCDVTLLEVRIETGEAQSKKKHEDRTRAKEKEKEKEEEEDDVIDLKTSTRRIYERPPDRCPHRIQSELKTYDFVIEAISAYKTTTDSDGAPASSDIAAVTIKGGWYGRCPLSQHALIQMHPLEAQDSEYEKQWHTGSPAEMKIASRKPSFMAKEFGWASFPKGIPMPLEVTATSCGMRRDQTPVHELKCLLRIYPKDDWSVKLQIPALSERKFGFSKTWDVHGLGHPTQPITLGNSVTNQSSSKESLGSPVSKTGHTTTRDSKGAVIKEVTVTGRTEKPGYSETSLTTESENGHTRNSFARSKTNGNLLHGTTRKTLSETGAKDEGAEREIKPSLSITRNGSELNVTKALNSILNVIEKAKETFENFHNLLKVVPKVGFTVDASLTLFEGSLSYARGYKVSKALHGDRYTAVTPYVSFGAAMKIFEARVELGFGFDLTIPNICSWFATKNILEIVLKVAGSMTGCCDLESSWTKQEKSEVEVALKPSLGFKVGLVFKATALGFGVRAEIGIKSKGLVFAGKAVFGFEEPPFFTIDFHVDGGSAYGYYFIDTAIWDVSDDFDHPLWDPKPIRKGKFPTATAAAAAD